MAHKSYDAKIVLKFGCICLFTKYLKKKNPPWTDFDETPRMEPVATPDSRWLTQAMEQNCAISCEIMDDVIAKT